MHTLTEAKKLKRLLEPLGFQVELAPAVQVEELQTLLRKHTPDILHFAGHGDQAGDLQAQDEDGNAIAIPMDALAEAVRIHNREQSGSLRLIVLNACYAARQAEQLARHVECVIAAHEPIARRQRHRLCRGVLWGAGRRFVGGRGFEYGCNQVDLIEDLPPVKEDLALLTSPTSTPSKSSLPVHSRPSTRPICAIGSTTVGPASHFRSLACPTAMPACWTSTCRCRWTGGWFFTILPEQVDPLTDTDWEFSSGTERAAGSDPEREYLEQFEDLGPDDESLARERRARTRHWAALDADETALRSLVVRAVASHEAETDEDVDHQLVAEDAAAIQRHFVLVGDPGSGKSSFLRFLTLSLAGDLLRQSGAPCPQAGDGIDRSQIRVFDGLTPVYIELHSLFTMESLRLSDDENVQPSPPSVADFWRYLTDRLRVLGVEQALPELRRLYDAGKLLILLDGLDEVNNAAEPRRRWQIKRLAAALARSDNRLIITSRPYAYRNRDWSLEGFGRTELIDLQTAQLEELTSKLISILSPDDAAQAQRDFLAELDGVRADLRSNPLFFTLLAAIWLRPPRRRRLPATRGELYRRSVDLLLEDWVRQKDDEFSLLGRLKLTPDELRAVLQVLALLVQQRSQPGTDTTVFASSDIHTAIEYVHTDRRHTPVVRFLELIAGVLQDVTDDLERQPGLLIAPYTRQFRFLHRSFQEHLAACELIPDGGDNDHPRHGFPETLVQLVSQNPALWRNVAELAADELRFQGREPHLSVLLIALSASYRQAKAKEMSVLPDGSGPAALLALTIARDQELLQSVTDADGPDVLVSTLQATATHALTDIETFSPEERDIAGTALALLGDRRKGVGLRADGLPDIDWVEIPEIDPETGQREFIYQEDERRSEPTFWMARYPVTYRQFQAFVDADDGFYNDEWWAGLSVPEGHRSAPGEQGFEHWNHPRERVSWYDAIAFCRWLTAKASATPDLAPQMPPPGEGMVWAFTLPTEWQWEKAARGYDGRNFPWGDEYVSGFANINETYSDQKVGDHYLQKTSAVGMYPQGVSPYGIHDMSGNVWEWCLNEYSNPDNVQESGNASRTLRGGSWSYNQDVARSVRRNTVQHVPVDRLHTTRFSAGGVSGPY